MYMGFSNENNGHHLRVLLSVANLSRSPVRHSQKEISSLGEFYELNIVSQTKESGELKRRHHTECNILVLSMPVSDWRVGNSYISV
jgi:hypothetical protein